MIKKEELFKIGQFAKPHGIKGEIALLAACDFFDDIDDLYLVCEIDGIFVPFFIESYRYKTDNVTLVKLENIDSDNAVKIFINQDVYFPSEVMDASGFEGNITFDNFIGYKITDENRGCLGEISNVDDSTQNVLFSVDYNGKELLIPAVEEFIIKINHEEKSLTTNIPDGLFEL
jgi:16S rRNA processing protein RimM